MKKFSKLLAVVLAIAVVICPMMSVVSFATATGDYKLEATSANDLKLTVSSTTGFLVYSTTVAFDDSSAFQSTYSSNGYTNGIKLIDYSLVDAEKDEHNLPNIQVSASGTNLSVLVSSTDAATLDLYSSVVIGIRVDANTIASISKIQAADGGDGQTVASDATLLGFTGTNATTGAVDTTSDYYVSNGTTNAHAHSFTETTIKDAANLKTAATCQADAVYYKTCATCHVSSNDDSYTFVDTGSQLAHTPSNTKTNKKSNANCTTGSVYYKECSVCHTQLTDTWTDTDALGHSMQSYGASSATCVATGNIAYYQCSRCTNYYADTQGNTQLQWSDIETAATGVHNPSNTTKYPVSAATCKDDAVYNKECSVCGCELVGNTWTDTGSSSSVEHTWGAYSSNGDATCKADGTKTRICSVCDAQDTVTDTGSSASVQHTWGAYSSNGDATCTEDGTKTRICSVCDAQDTVADTGSAKNHSYNYTSNSNGTHNGVCANDASHVVTNEACDTAGTDGACSKCGYKEAPSACAHTTLASAVYEANTATGCKDMVKRCSVCNAEIYRFATTIPAATTVNSIAFSAGCGLSTSAQFSYKVTKSSIPTGCTAKVQIYRQATDTSYNFYNEDCGAFNVPLTSKNNYVYFSNIALCQLTLPVAAVLCVYDSNNALVSVSAPTIDVYVDLLWSIYSKDTTADAMKTCFVDLLNIASECQTLFAKAGSDLANEPLAIDMYPFDKTLATKNLPDYSSVPNSCVVNPSANTSTTVHALTPSVSITSGAPVIAYYIAGTKTDQLDKSKLSVTMSWTDGKGKAQSVTASGDDWLNTTKNRIYYTLADCALYDTNKTITAVFTYDGVEMYTSTYSVDTYVSLNYTNASIGTAMAYIGKLGASARALFGLS